MAVPQLPIRHLRPLDIYRSINPYSEAHFKTLKYRPDFPGSFDTLQTARAWCRRFFDHYNDYRRHSGIGLLTPAVVHHGQADAVRRARAAVLDAAYTAHPERFVHRPPTPPKLPTPAWINRPQQDSDEPDQPALRMVAHPTIVNRPASRCQPRIHWDQDPQATLVAG